MIHTKQVSNLEVVEFMRVCLPVGGCIFESCCLTSTENFDRKGVLLIGFYSHDREQQRNASQAAEIFDSCQQSFKRVQFFYIKKDTTKINDLRPLFPLYSKIYYRLCFSTTAAKSMYCLFQAGR